MQLNSNKQQSILITLLSLITAFPFCYAEDKKLNCNSPIKKSFGTNIHLQLVINLIFFIVALVYGSAPCISRVILVCFYATKN
jgi:ABC-type phosphate/phosphonate transport system permease subunit